MRRISLIFLAFALWLGAAARTADAGFALVAHTAIGGPSTFTSAAINTTGAALIVVSKSWFGASEPALTDSASNTWIAGTIQSAGGPQNNRLYYVISPTTNASHTFTLTGTNIFANIGVAAFSGTPVVFLSQTGAFNNGTVTSIQPGSLSSSGVTGALFIAGLNCTSGTSPTIDSGYTAYVVSAVSGGSGNDGGGIAYLIAGSSTSFNPTWSWTVANEGASAAMVFLPTIPVVGICQTVAQTSGSVVVTWATQGGSFDGATTITPTATDVTGATVGSWSSGSVTPANNATTATLTYTAPATETQPVLITFTTNNAAKYTPMWQYIAGSQVAGQATGAGTTGTLIDATNFNVNTNYIGHTINIVGGTDIGQSSIITSVNTGTKTFNFSPPLTTATDTTSKYGFDGQNGIGQFALYAQRAAVPTRFANLSNGYVGYTTSPGTDPNFACPRIRDVWNGFVYAGTSTINVDFLAAPGLTRYEVRDRKGVIKVSGTASGATVPISLAGLANGPYEIGLFGSVSNATWGDRHISLWFGIIPHTTHVYDTQPLFWAYNLGNGTGWIDYGGAAIKTASEAPGANSSGAWPYYVKRTGTLTPTVTTGTFYLRQSMTGARRLTFNGTTYDDVLGATAAFGEYSNGVSTAVVSGTAYPITLEAAPSQAAQSDGLKYSTDNVTYTAVPASWYTDSQSNANTLTANYYGQQFLAIEAYLNTHERISTIANAHPLDELNAFGLPYFNFIINNLANRDSQRPITPFINFPGYRKFLQLSTGVLTANVSTSLTLDGNGSVALFNSANLTYKVIAGVRLKFPSTGEVVTVANTWSSSTPTTIPLTAAVQNSYAANAQVTIDPVYEDAAVTSAANWLTTNFPGQTFGLEPTNEPNVSDPTLYQKPFYLAVQAATTPTQFKVMGPCSVVEHSSNYLSGSLEPSGYEKVFGDNGGYAFDQQYSGHLYQSDCGDRSVLPSHLADLNAHKTAYGITTKFVDSEFGYRNVLNGILVPMRQAEWLGQTLILAEPLGIPYQNFPYWYLNDHSDFFWNTGLQKFQSDTFVGSYGPMPAALLMRNFKEQLFGTSPASTTALNFGNAKDMIFGNLYHRPGSTNSVGGTDTICLMSANRDLSVAFQVAGGDGSLHCVDAYGNTSTVAVSSGQATVGPVGEPFFIQLESGQLASPLTGQNWGTDYCAAAQGGTITVTGGSSTNLSAVIGGTLQSAYTGGTPYTDATIANPANAQVPNVSNLPITFTDVFGGTQSITQAEWYCPAPFQSVGGTILDWSWDYSTNGGSTWTSLVARQKRYPIQEAFFSSYAQSLVTDFSDHNYMHVDSFSSTSCNAIRLNVYAVSNGGAMSQLAQESGTDGAAFYPFAAVAGIRARSTTALPPPGKASAAKTAIGIGIGIGDPGQ